jgi:magnesium chelatase subunit D
MARTATAHAAWAGRTTLTAEDLKVAAKLALPHRRRRNPFDAPGLDEDQLDRLLDEPESDPEPEPDPPSGGDDPGGRDRESPPPADPEGQPADGQPKASRSTTTASVGEPYRARVFTVPGVGGGEAGRRSVARTDTGRRVGAERPVGPTGTMHLLETLRAAARHQHRRGRRSGRLLLAPEDLRVPIKEGRESNNVLFCVDASGSMAASRRMRAVKTAILSLLTDAYQRRDKVGLVTFRGAAADLVLPPTGSVEVAVTRLRDLAAGGRTPLAEALARVAEVVRVEALRDPRRRQLLVLVTDGRATHGPDALGRAHRTAAALGRTGLSSVVVDCETGRFRMGLARRLAELLGAAHVPVDEVSAVALTRAARAA